MASIRALSHAPWSSSKIQMALRCPRLFHYRYVEKLAEPEVMPEARIGKAVHDALERALGGAPHVMAVAAARELLPDGVERARFDHLSGGIPPFLERIAAFRRKRRVGRELIEFSLAMRENTTSTQFYAGDALFRGVFDVGFMYEDGNLAVIDHKTGARYPNLAISDQLEGYAVLAAAWFRSIRKVWLGVHWVADAEVDWVRPLTMAEIRHDLVPRVLTNIEAAALAVDDGPRANPGVWCERCNYRSVCPSGIEFRFEPVDDDEPELE
ncbi:MAG TPA: PD-(D/E)XK nuclease family protein [Kofleriaceae bacterium]|nr:PD-(D/E)XK nuclease family protein [Kofleriaceae bacterium]